MSVAGVLVVGKFRGYVARGLAAGSVSPTISVIAVSDVQNTSVDVAVSTTGDDGSIFYLTNTSASAPADGPTLESASDGSQAVSVTGVQTLNDITVTETTTPQYVHVVHKNAGGEYSNILTSISFKTSNPPVFQGSVIDNDWQRDEAISIIAMENFFVPTGDSYSVASGALPSGVVLNTSTGEISGSPTGLGSGSVSIRATNADGTADSNSFSWVVGDSPQFSGTVSDQTWVIDQSITPIDLTSFFAPAAESFASIGDALPAGLVLAAGIISGTPTEVVASLDLQFRATNGYGNNDTNAFNISVESPPVFAGTVSDKSYTIGVAITPVDLSPFFTPSPASYSVASGTLPDGLSIVSGVLQGTPTTAVNANIVVRGTNPYGTDDTNSFAIGVSAASNPTLTLVSQTAVAISTNDVTSNLATLAGGFTAEDLVLTDLDGASAEYNLNAGGWTSIGAGVTLSAVDDDDTLQLRLDVGATYNRTYRIRGVFQTSGVSFTWVVRTIPDPNQTGLAKPIQDADNSTAVTADVLPSNTVINTGSIR